MLSCSIDMCLRWTLKGNRITFICTIDDLHFPVDFFDNHGHIIAHCVSPKPSPKCRQSAQIANFKVHVEQFPYKNETILILAGTIDQRFNGNWSCRHGVNLNEAQVDINILHVLVEKGII